jgi:hypothetical protein
MPLHVGGGSGSGVSPFVIVGEKPVTLLKLRADTAEDFVVVERRVHRPPNGMHLVDGNVDVEAVRVSVNYAHTLMLTKPEPRTERLLDIA